MSTSQASPDPTAASYLELARDVGVEVGGVEYCFGSGGVRRQEPGQHPAEYESATLKETVSLGTTTLTPKELARIVDALKAGFPAETHDLLLAPRVPRPRAPRARSVDRPNRAGGETRTTSLPPSRLRSASRRLRDGSINSRTPGRP